jgi:hypothetical protein
MLYGVRLPHVDEQLNQPWAPFTLGLPLVDHVKIASTFCSASKLPAGEFFKAMFAQKGVHVG